MPDDITSDECLIYDRSIPSSIMRRSVCVVWLSLMIACLLSLPRLSVPIVADLSAENQIYTTTFTTTMEITYNYVTVTNSTTVFGGYITSTTNTITTTISSFSSLTVSSITSTVRTAANSSSSNIAVTSQSSSQNLPPINGFPTESIFLGSLVGLCLLLLSRRRRTAAAR
jgi:hypothetical protein